MKELGLKVEMFTVILPFKMGIHLSDQMDDELN